MLLLDLLNKKEYLKQWRDVIITAENSILPAAQNIDAS